MKKIKYLILLVVVLIGVSCEPTYVKEYSWAYPIAGDWKLTAYVDGEVDSDPFEVKIYNSAFGKDSVWIDDYDGNYWDMKFKVAVDMNNKTFSTSRSTNKIEDYDIDIKVTNGKVIGTDSITMDVEFGDDLGTIYQLKGHRIVSYEDYMGH